MSKPLAYSFYDGETVKWSKDTTLTVKDLPRGYYQYTAIVSDIYGNTYSASTAVIYFDGTKSTIKTITYDRLS